METQAIKIPFKTQLRIAFIGGFIVWIISPIVLLSLLFNRGAKAWSLFGDDNSVDNSQETVINNYYGNAPQELAELADGIAEDYQVPPDLFFALLQAESAWNPRATSPKGARGLGQVMPATARQKCNITDPDDLYDPETNLHCSARILRAEIVYWSRRYEDIEDIIVHVLGSYNAGRQAVLERDAVNSFGETRRYIARIMHTMSQNGGE